jgi:hypothetical protein
VRPCAEQSCAPSPQNVIVTVALTSVKHAGADTLELIETLLIQLRAVDGLVERKPGVFYRRSRAFLHFHEDPTSVYADLRLTVDEDFTRMRVSTATEQAHLLRQIKRLGATSKM